MDKKRKLHDWNYSKVDMCCKYVKEFNENIVGTVDKEEKLQTF